MNEDLKRLVRLQNLMQSAEGLDEKIAAVPKEIARFEKSLLALQDDLEKQRAHLGDVQKDRRKLEMDLMSVEGKIGKYQGQLLGVKTNKEYQTMLHEIETCRAERAALDEKILYEMEEAEKRHAGLRVLEERLKEQRRATEEGKKRLDESLQGFKREKAGVLEEQRTLSGTITPRYLEPFLKVARQRKGLALVAVRDELCGGCHVRVMPKLIQEVRRATGLIACDTCKRFLYVHDDPNPAGAGAVPGASGVDPAAGSPTQ